MLNLVKPQLRDAVPRRLQAARAARPARRVGRRAAENIFKGENGLPLEIDATRRALRQARARRDDLRRRRRDRRRRRRRAARPADAQRRRHLRRRRDDLRAGRHVRRRARGHLPRRPVPRRGREAARRHPRDGRALARARRERQGPRDRRHPDDAARRPRRARLRPPASGGRWCCRSSSRSDAQRRAQRPRQRRRAVRRRRRVAATRSPRSGVREVVGAPAGSWTRGSRTTKRAPGSASSSATSPPWASATARTIASPRPVEPPRSPPARDEALEDPLAQLGRDAGAVVLDREHDAPSSALRRGPSIVRARRRVVDRVLDEVEDQPVQLVARAVDDDGPARRRPRARARPTSAPASPTASTATAPRSTGASGARWPASDAREQQQVGDQAAHPPRASAARTPRPRRCSPSSSSASSSRFASTLRSAACAARARRRRRTRAGGRARPRSRAREPSSAREHLVERPRQLGDLVVGERLRAPGGRGRRCARCRARSRSARRSGASRGARAPGRRAARAACRRGRRRQEPAHARGSCSLTSASGRAYSIQIGMRDRVRVGRVEPIGATPGASRRGSRRSRASPRAPAGRSPARRCVRLRPAAAARRRAGSRRRSSAA